MPSLDQLRALLRSPSDLILDWEQALIEVAVRAKQGLNANRSMVAIPIGFGWKAFVDSGQTLCDDLVGLVASTSVLARAFSDGIQRESVKLNQLRRTGSIDRHSIHSVLALPLRRFGHRDPSAPVIGVLYLDRREGDLAFTEDDEQWAQDYASLTERSLTLIELLARTRRERDAARIDTETLLDASGTRQDGLESRDRGFQASVGKILLKAAAAERVTVLLQGPTGSGKTCLARNFHAVSHRSERAFVTLDCSQTSNSDALGAELFGFARKSGFNVDRHGRPGKAALADGGILFLDEINSMPLELQPRLLRLVESGRYSPLGSSEELHVDVQIIAAANEDLRQAVRERRFREDLYFRLSEITLTLPGLNDRRADIAMFAERMLVAEAKRRGAPLHFSGEAMAILEDFAWARAGNLRGLAHTIRRTVLMLDADAVRVERDDLILPELLGEPEPGPASSTGPSPSAGTPPNLRDVLRSKIAEHRGVLARLALDADLIRWMGTGGKVIPTSTLRQRLAKLDLLDHLESTRAENGASLEDVIAAIRLHGNGTAAAHALGISRDRVVWRLRQAGLTIGTVLATSTTTTPQR